MKVEQNKFVAVNYVLTVNGEVADRSREGQPLEFQFGTGMLLPKFEEAILGKEVGDKVEFTLAPKDGYGEKMDDLVATLPLDVFKINGEIQEGMLTPGNQIPMSDNQGNRMIGTVVSADSEKVVMDFNHPMAGKTLDFAVEIVEVRDVTPEDFAPQGCGCGCHGGDCDDNCGCDHHDHCGC